MANEYEIKYKKRKAYLESIYQLRARVNGQTDFDFTQLLAPGQDEAKITSWRIECFSSAYLAKVEYQVDEYQYLAQWEEADNREWNRKNRLPPTAAERREGVAAIRAARAAANDEPPPPPDETEDDTAVESPAEPPVIMRGRER
jgi:hypothetical protein